MTREARRARRPEPFAGLLASVASSSRLESRGGGGLHPASLRRRPRPPPQKKSDCPPTWNNEQEINPTHSLSTEPGQVQRDL